jgi:hypothetical protein
MPIESSTLKIIGDGTNAYARTENIVTRVVGQVFMVSFGGSDIRVLQFGSELSAVADRPGWEAIRYRTVVDILTGDKLVILNAVSQAGDPHFIIQRSSGAFYIAGDRLLYVSDAPSGDYYFSLGGNNLVNLFYNTLRISLLAAPWDTDYGIATDRKAGSVSEGTTFTHEADCLIEYTVTTLIDQVILFFRIQDATNYWRIRINDVGTILLQEVVGGGITSRGSAASVVSSGDRILIVAEGETISVYTNNVLRITYALAANFKTETDGELDDIGTSVVSDLVSWPRTLSGAAKAALDAVADA